RRIRRTRRLSLVNPAACVGRVATPEWATESRFYVKFYVVQRNILNNINDFNVIPPLIIPPLRDAISPPPNHSLSPADPMGDSHHDLTATLTTAPVMVVATCRCSEIPLADHR